MSRHHGDARLESVDPLLSRWQRRIGIGFTFDLRWRELREPWNQPRGTERDDLWINTASILMLCEPSGGVVAVGYGCISLYLHSPGETQARCMAVDRNWRGHGLATASSMLWKGTPKLNRCVTLCSQFA